MNWTQEKVDRFWSHEASRPVKHQSWWSNWVGGALIKFVSRHIKLRSPALDYGCGAGHLLEKLRCIGVVAAGYEPCDALRAVALREHRWYVFASPPQCQFRIVFCCEVLEHILPESLAATTKNLFGATCQGGHVVISVPNAEDLAANTVFCPECNSEFHRWQHQRSFNADSLQKLMESVGFETVLCQATHLRNGWQAKKDRFKEWLGLQSAQKPHLIYIGLKP